MAAKEVLLRRSIDGVGSVGEIVRVKPGYARNYLIPNSYAAYVTPDAMREVAKDKDLEILRETELGKKRALIAEKLKDLRITMEARAGVDGHLYGSVGARQLVGKFQELGYDFQERHIGFELVRELGEYNIDVNLGGGVVVPVKLWVVQDAQDAQAMAEDATRRAEAEAAGIDLDAPDPDIDFDDV